MLWDHKLELVVVTCHTDEDDKREECHPYWEQRFQNSEKHCVTVKSYSEHKIENEGLHDGVWVRELILTDG